MGWWKTRMSKDVIPRLQNGYRNAIDTLYPHRCPICGQIVDKQGMMCGDCGYKVKYITSPFCMVCGKQLDSEEKELCFDCRRAHHEYVRGVAAFAYTQELRESIYSFKYDNRREYASFYAESLAALRGGIIRSWHAQVLVPVPLHPKRYRARGYNQAELIALELGRRLDIPVDSTILARSVNTVPQKELDDKKRVQNTKNAFQVTDNIVKYKKIVLVDDIYTTGATLDACAAALKRAGAQQIYFAAVCVGRGF